MVKKIKDNNQILYVCDDCGMKYKDRYWAIKCENWCREHKSCNLEITKHAVG